MTASRPEKLALGKGSTPLFVESNYRSTLRDDIADLSDSVQEAFMADLVP